MTDVICLVPSHCIGDLQTYLFRIAKTYLSVEALDRGIVVHGKRRYCSVFDPMAFTLTVTYTEPIDVPGYIYGSYEHTVEKTALVLKGIRDNENNYKRCACGAIETEAFPSTMH